MSRKLECYECGTVLGSQHVVPEEEKALRKEHVCDPAKVREYRQTQEWESVHYRMSEEGFDYCFTGYSDWLEIEDKEFHRLKTQYLESMKELQKYIIVKRVEQVTAQMVSTSDVDEISTLKDQLYELDEEYKKLK